MAINMYNDCTNIKTTKLITDLYMAAITFFGEKYSKHIFSAIENVIFYECKENETTADALQNVARVNLNPEEKEALKTVPVITLDINSKNIIIYEKKALRNNQYLANIVRNIFGHTLCGRRKSIIIKNNNMYKRDGIALLGTNNNHKNYNIALNEGFMDWITVNILRIYYNDQNYKLDPKNLNDPLQYIASKIATAIGNENVFNDLIDGTTNNIETLLSTYFEVFSQALDTYYQKGKRHHTELIFEAEKILKIAIKNMEEKAKRNNKPKIYRKDKKYNKIGGMI